MDVEPTDEQRLVAETAIAVLGREHPTPTWGEVVSIGLAGLGLDESDGGSGGGVVDQAVICEAAGWTLSSLPLLTVYVARAALAGGDTAGPASGRPALAVADDHGRWRADDPAVRWRGGELTGVRRFVRGAAGADRLLVGALDPADGFTLVEVATAQPGVVIRDLPAIAEDAWSTVELDRARGVPRAVRWEAVNRALMVAGVLQAAWCAGAGRRLLGETIAYVSRRHVFGVPVGSFQTVQHRLVDAHMSMAESQLLARRAAWSLATGDRDAQRLAATAFLHATASLVALARDCHQVWGGIGYTTDAPVHRFSRAAKVARQSWGGPAHHSAVVAAALQTIPLRLRRYNTGRPPSPSIA